MKFNDVRFVLCVRDKELKVCKRTNVIFYGILVFVILLLIFCSPNLPI